VNCGGRGHRGGLKVHDEIIAVNNFDVDKHPLTLHRQTEEQDSKEINQSDQLTKLDFTYQLIKHTLNRQLHLSVRRHSDSELARHIYYHVENEDDEAVYQQQSEEEILSPSEDFDATEIIIPPPDIDFSEEPESQAGPSEPIDQQSDKTSDILPLALSPDTDDSDMPTISGPTYKAKAPKNVWSPGSTSNSSSSTQTTIPATAHRTSTPEPESLPDSFRPSKLSTSSLTVPHKSSERLTDAHITSLSPTLSEETPEFNDNQIENITDIYDPQSPPIHKYWTLPRNIATATKLQYQKEDEQQL
jgi:hypothetical protein